MELVRSVPEPVPVAGVEEDKDAIEDALDGPEDLWEEVIPQCLERGHVESALLCLRHVVELEDATQSLPDVLEEVVTIG